DPAFEAWFAIFHQRYSTNTSPTWERAQPFRMLCHNGEINTIAGNVHRMRGREGRLGFPDAPDEELYSPVLDEDGSDSAMLDESVELLSREGPGGGRDIRAAVGGGTLGRGGMLVLDARAGCLQRDPVARVARRRPSAVWLEAHRVAGSAGRPDPSVPTDLQRRQVAHAYTREDLSLALRPAA